jgi:hypothetical protein
MRLDPAPGTLFNLADCEERAGKLASSWLHWQQLVDTLRSRPNDERLPVAQKHVSDLAPRLPRLRVRWVGAPPQGATVKRDGVEMGEPSMNNAIPIDPGPHVVEVSAPNRKSKTFNVTTKEASVTDLDIALEETTPTKPETKPIEKPSVVQGETHQGEVQKPIPEQPQQQESSGSPGLSAVGWVSTILGGLLTVGGTLFGVGAIAQKSSVESQCNTEKVCTPDGASAASSGQAFATASTVMLVAGPILVAAGVTLIIVGGKSSQTKVLASPTSLVIEGRF